MLGVKRIKVFLQSLTNFGISARVQGKHFLEHGQFFRTTLTVYSIGTSFNIVIHFILLIFSKSKITNKHQPIATKIYARSLTGGQNWGVWRNEIDWVVGGGRWGQVGKTFSFYFFDNKINITSGMQTTQTDPYNYPFLKKDETMYLSTITKNDFKPSISQYYRQSSFQKKDIEGANPRILIPHKPNDTTYSLSTYVEPIPGTKPINKTSNPLYHADIEGSNPKSHQFRTNRVVDPLCPVYKLPTAAEISVDPGKNFMRDTLSVSDINNKRRTLIGDRGRDVLKEPIAGSAPSQLTKLIKANSNLQVKDINKDGIFESTRSTNPLVPTYNWRDEQGKGPNEKYGDIRGTAPKQMHPLQISPNRPQNTCLNIGDIEGTKSNSAYSRAHFIDKRRQFRNYMVTNDIEKANSSSLKKGIETKRTTNPLMPNYQFLGHSQVQK